MILPEFKVQQEVNVSVWTSLKVLAFQPGIEDAFGAVKAYYNERKDGDEARPEVVVQGDDKEKNGIEGGEEKKEVE